MPIQMSLPGFIATAPELNFMGIAAARFYARLGVEHYRKETDGCFTKLDCKHGSGERWQHQCSRRVAPER
jgi:hypothetical protein